MGEIRSFADVAVAARKRDEDIPDMRGIKETAARFRLPEHFVRALALKGQIVAVRAGSRKIYINQQSMVDFLNGKATGGVAL